MYEPESQPLELLSGVPVDVVTERMARAGGNEISSGKFASSESSAALAVNTFGWFLERPILLPRLPGIEPWECPEAVEIEYCARFPWSGGRHPWLDAMVQTPTYLIGVESKRYEPFRDRKTVSLSSAYDRPVWGDRMQPIERMRDALRSGEQRFDYLDASQLVKHAFGLVTDGRRRQRQPVLVYLYAEPAARNGTPLPPAAFTAHRAEITHFAAQVSGAEVAFHAVSYREWLATWQGAAVEAHAQAVLDTFQP